MNSLPHEAVDQPIYGYYRQVSDGLPELQALRSVNDLEVQKAKFISQGFEHNPDLTPIIDRSKLRAKQWGLVALRDAIVEDTNLPEVVSEAYVPVIESGLSSVEMLMAATDGDVEKYVQANQEVYGEVDPFVFAICSNYFEDFIKDSLDSDHVLVRAAASQADAVLPDTSSNAHAHWPSAGKFKAIKDLFSDFYDFASELDLPETIKGSEAMPAMERAVKSLAIGYAVKSRKAGISTMATDIDKKEIYVPMDQTYTRERFIGLIGHEVRIHAEESINALNQPLKLLRDGLARSIYAGEGKGVLVEQLVYKKMKDFMQTRRFFDIARRHLAIGAAQGIDGNGERDFKEVFAIVNALDMLWEIQHNPDEPLVKSGSRALDKSWELLAKRTNKGPAGKGSAHFKDKVYLEGNLKQWDLLSEHPNAYKYLNLGKYDLTEPSHAKILRKLGMLPRNMSLKLK